MNPDPLAQLRDIHLPEAIGWWPPAPGWWLLTLLFILALAFTVRYLLTRRQNLYFRREANSLIKQCWENYQHNNDDRLFVETLFGIVRRAAISRSPSLSTEEGNSPNANNSALLNNKSESDAMPTEQLFAMLDTCSGGQLAQHINRMDIDNLLYQKNPVALKTEQSMQLHRAAAGWLKKGVHQ